MKQAYVKGTDIRIVGTLETLQGCANIQGFNEDGSVEYSGDTEIFWDGLETVTNDKGETLYMDEDGEQYTIDQLEFRDEPDGD